MAGLAFAAVRSAIALTASQSHTLVQIIAPSSQSVLITEVVVSYDGITAADPPILTDIVKQSDAGTMSALTPKKINDGDPETLNTTAQYGASGTEPTTTDLLYSEYVHEQGGNCIINLRHLPGGGIKIKGGGRIGIRYTATTLTATTHATVTVHGEE